MTLLASDDTLSVKGAGEKENKKTKFFFNLQAAKKYLCYLGIKAKTIGCLLSLAYKIFESFS